MASNDGPAPPLLDATFAALLDKVCRGARGALGIDNCVEPNQHRMCAAQVCSPLPVEHNIRSSVRSRLEQLWSSPRVDALSAVLGHAVTVEEARQSLFFPDASAAAQYASLIKDPPLGSPEDHPQVGPI